MSGSPEISLRAATAADVDAIRSLVDAAYEKWIPLIGRLPLPMRADYAVAVREHDFTLTHVDGALVGLIETERKTDHLYIVNVAVSPVRQGRGIGRALLAHAENEARAAGYIETRLITNALYDANIRLYLSVGYAITSREPFMGGEVVYMAKRLG